MILELIQRAKNLICGRKTECENIGFAHDEKIGYISNENAKKYTKVIIKKYGYDLRELAKH